MVKRKAMNVDAPHFFITLMHSATQAHTLHLRTKSYAKHVALDTLYKELPVLADDIVEAYQGIHGIVDEYPAITISMADDDVGFVKALQSYVAQHRACVGKETELQNLIDEVAELLDTTLYKLENLS